MSGVGMTMKAVLVWLMRRGTILLFSLMYLVSLPKQMWSSRADHRDGVGFFADPLGKPSLMTHWKSLMSMSYSTLFTRTKPPTEEGVQAAKDSPTAIWGDDGITVETRPNYVEFVQKEGTCAKGQDKGKPVVGIIILPGALVSHVAYAPLARTMTQKGYPSFIVRFDFDIANFGWERIDDVLDAKSRMGGEAESDKCSAPVPTKWILIGHSLGTMAIEKFYPDNPDKIDGVVYMGSGNRIGEAMAGLDVPALLFRGTRDPFCPADALAKSAHKLPKDTDKITVEGGNHRGYASYTWQPLDWEATITHQEQRSIVVDGLLDFIDKRIIG